MNINFPRYPLIEFVNQLVFVLIDFSSVDLLMSPLLSVLVPLTGLILSPIIGLSTIFISLVPCWRILKLMICVLYETRSAQLGSQTWMVQIWLALEAGKQTNHTKEIPVTGFCRGYLRVWIWETTQQWTDRFDQH